MSHQLQCIPSNMYMNKYQDQYFDMLHEDHMDSQDTYLLGYMSHLNLCILLYKYIHVYQDQFFYKQHFHHMVHLHSHLFHHIVFHHHCILRYRHTSRVQVLSLSMSPICDKEQKHMHLVQDIHVHCLIEYNQNYKYM